MMLIAMSKRKISRVCLILKMLVNVIKIKTIIITNLATYINLSSHNSNSSSSNNKYNSAFKMKKIKKKQ